MSFYNVSNPTTFNVVSDKRFALAAQGKVSRTSSQQLFVTGALTAISAEQLIGGVVYMYEDFTLPSATDLITLLLGPGGFDVSNNDIFSFRAVNLSGSNHTISSGTGGSGSITVTANTEKFINIKITITVSAGSTTYGYTTF